MCKRRKVTFDPATKPPNDGEMKICTKRKTPVYDENDIDLVMKHTGFTREKAIEALRKNDGDFVKAILFC